MDERYDAVVVGAGPNGLAAAIRLAQEGRSVLLLEAAAEVGGAARSAELTRPGFVHDLGSAVHPFAVGSPFLSTLPLEDFGLEWVYPEIDVGHPLDGGRAAFLYRDLERTVERLPDGRKYRRFVESLVDGWPNLAEDILRPMIHMPTHVGDLLKFGVQALMPARMLARTRLSSEESRALFAGIAAHSGLSFGVPLSSAVGLVLTTLGHAVGWPLPKGGAGNITRAMAAYFESLGGTIRTDTLVTDLAELPGSRVVLLDLTPAQFLTVAGKRLTGRYRRALENYRYGPASFKMDFALSEPVPWLHPDMARAATVHLGGTLDEIAEAEGMVHDRRIPERPYVLLVQPTVCDPSRAPEGKHIVWAYCHVPLRSEFDMRERLVGQIERFAPGFRETVIEASTFYPHHLEMYNANLVGGDIMGGSGDLVQTIARPVLSPKPHRTPIDGVYLCSSSTPPGPGVHGMSGYNAAMLALRDHLR